ncbi:MFS transporter [Streptomyces sp. NPDC018031]|uniref:MFS transporter n=1 Tax=Streptomyces sp. NPDC018031 TaxID=3365033 RepID=UPI0037B6F1F1
MADSSTGADRKWWAFTGVGILSFLGCIDLTIVNTAAPDIQSHFDATVTELQLIVNMFIVALSMFMVTMGRLADLHGRRRVLYCGTVVFGAASLGAGFAEDVTWLVICRFAQGAACAVLYTSTGAIVSATFPEHERGKAIGALYGVNGLGLAIGPMLGGFLVSWLSWRWVFWLNVPLIVVALLICVPTVRESRSEERGGVDPVGLCLLTAGLPAVVLGLTLGDSWGWASGRVLGLLIGGGVALAAFCHAERKVRHPMIQFRLFAHRDFLSAIVADFSLAFFYCTALFLIPLYLHSVRGYEGHVTGLLLLPCTAVVAVLSPLVGRLVDRYRPHRLLCAGFVAFAVAALLLAHLTPDRGTGYLITAFTAMGVGWALVLGPATVASLSAVPPRLAGTAVGSSWTFHNLGGAFGLAAGMAAYRWSAEDALHQDLADRGIPDGDWVDEVVAAPDDGPELLADHTELTDAEISQVFGDFFTSGNRSAMWLLFAVSLTALAVIAVGLRSRGGRPAERREPADPPLTDPRSAPAAVPCHPAGPPSGGPPV